jgi:CDP-diacylglycerol--glycerol-3-phosphate 3-phosphatidyltransferase
MERRLHDTGGRGVWQAGARLTALGTEEYAPDVKLNVPTVLTLLRILAIPGLLVVLEIPFAGRDIVAFAIFVAASITDGLDGWLARRWGQTTVLGQLLDPTADKLLIASALICLVALKRVPAWMAVVIIGRELAVSGLRAIASSRGVTIPASFAGKVKMGFETWTIAALILGPGPLGRIYIVAQVGLWLALGACLVSATEYFIRFWSLITSEKA